MKSNYQMVKNWRAAQAAQGLCWSCAQPAMPGKRYCQRHNDAQVDRARRRYADAGTCLNCASPPEPNRRRCRRHLDLAAAHARMMRR